LAVALTDAASGAGDRDGLAPYIVYAAKLYTCQVLVSTVDRQLRRHVSRTSNAIVKVIIDGGS
jgi:hypothetical protein